MCNCVQMESVFHSKIVSVKLEKATATSRTVEKSSNENVVRTYVFTLWSFLWPV